MDEDKIKLEVRLSAMEYVLNHIGKALFIYVGFDQTNIAEMRQNARDQILSETFPGFVNPRNRAARPSPLAFPESAQRFSGPQEL